MVAGPLLPVLEVGLSCFKRNELDVFCWRIKTAFWSS